MLSLMAMLYLLMVGTHHRYCQPVRLLPREQNRLQVFAAAELARRRRARGLLLSQAEAVALICDEVMEAARDGLDYAAVEQRGYEILYPADVLEDVPRLVARIELEALFADGHRLIVLHDPITSGVPPSLDEGNVEPLWLEGGRPLRLANRSDVPIALTSHFHVFEANRRLHFDRSAAWGMRLAVAAGVKVVIEPGQAREVRVVPFGGARIVRGHGGLVDGPLDAPGAREAALALARERGTVAPDRVRLADSDLWLAPAGEPDEIVAGWGGTMRDGLGVRAERGGVEVAVTG